MQCVCILTLYHSSNSNTACLSLKNNNWVFSLVGDSCSVRLEANKGIYQINMLFDQTVIELQRQVFFYLWSTDKRLSASQNKTGWLGANNSEWKIVRWLKGRKWTSVLIGGTVCSNSAWFGVSVYLFVFFRKIFENSSKERIVKRKKTVCQDFIPPPSMYIFKCVLRRRERIYLSWDISRVHLDSSSSPSASS